jgi:hypothetical protein
MLFLSGYCDQLPGLPKTEFTNLGFQSPDPANIGNRFRN